MGSDRPYEWLTYRIEKILQHKSNLFKLFTSANGLEFKQINPIRRKSEKRYQTNHAFHIPFQHKTTLCCEVS